LRQVSIYSTIKQFTIPLIAVIIIIAGCSLEKKSGFNRGMQNITARYNILFNANEIIRQKQESYTTSFIDNYNEILSVYQDTTPQTTTPDKDLESAIAKGNKIITIKEQSNYIGDAYLVLGKANYLEGNYFNAVEYFSYVIRSFPKEKKLFQKGLIWKTRTLMYLNQLAEAKPVIDTAIQSINPKKRVNADIYATKLQYDIDRCRTMLTERKWQSRRYIIAGAKPKNFAGHLFWRSCRNLTINRVRRLRTIVRLLKVMPCSKWLLMPV